MNIIKPDGFPKVVCLCGSTRFMNAFYVAGWNETMKGNIVLSVGVVKNLITPDGEHAGEAFGDIVCRMLDELHLRKIDLADEILVLNVDGYIGKSTQNEIEYAQKTNKPIKYLEPVQ